MILLVIHSKLYTDIENLHIQWNPSIAATLGEQHFGHYVRVAFIERLFCTQTVHLGPGRYIAVGLNSGVAVPL